MADNELPNIFPIFRKQAPLIESLKKLRAHQGGKAGGAGQTGKAGITSEDLNEAQRKMMSQFRAGLAGALGVPPEAIREEPLEKWIVEFTLAFVKPEFYAQALVSMSEADARDLGIGLGELMGSLIAEAEAPAEPE